MEKEAAFLEDKVRCVLEPMINSVLKDNPEDPVKYMIQWVNRYMGLSNESSTEKEELSNLRKEIAQYKSQFADEDKEMAVSSEGEDADELQDEFDKEIEAKQMKRKGEKLSNQRTSVSAEVFGEHHKKTDYVPRVVPKTEDQRLHLFYKTRHLEIHTRFCRKNNPFA